MQYADADNRPQSVSPVQQELDATVTEPAAVESRWALLRQGRFLMLWAGQLTGLIGDSFNYVAVAWLVLQLTGSSLAVGSILASRSAS